MGKKRAGSRALEWDDLRYFLASVRAQTFTKAAHLLDVDPTTIPRRIVALENAVGTKLLQRSKGSFQLTDAGCRMVDHAIRMEGLADTLMDDVGGRDAGPAGIVRIGAPEVFGNYFLAPHLARVGEMYPGLSLELVSLPWHVSLFGREADIAIMFQPPKTGPYVAGRLAEISLRLYASRRYLAARPAIKTTDDLDAHSFVTYIDDRLFSKDKSFGVAWSGARNIVFRANSMFAQYRAVVMGAGIAVLSDFLASQDAELVPVLSSEIRLRRTCWIVCEEELRKLGRIQAAMRYLRKVVEEGRRELLPDHGQQQCGLPAKGRKYS